MENKMLLIKNPGKFILNQVNIKQLYKLLKMIKNLCYHIFKKFLKEQNPC